MAIQQDYLERVYAGWLGKIIGVRYGAPIEGWTFDQIRRSYGTLSGYVADYETFAADDDTNGPMFFLRAIDDYGLDATTEQMGLTWLNYAPYEHGFYWWGRYGISTEHTAYLNLRAGIMAPRSGSIEQNGAAVAEQIGGQIFIDTWGLIAPGNPRLAADYAGKMASVSHGGNGIYGGQFMAACIAQAFVEQDMQNVIEAGLSVIPADCEYRRMADAVIAFHQGHQANWEEAFHYVQANFGYDRYPGNCHIIPNSAVIILSLLYGAGDFDRALNICNMCGWDTDCNVANVGTIMGVMLGIQGINDDRWRAPVNDFLAASSVMGSMNIMDVPTDAAYIAALGYRIAGEQPPAHVADIIQGKAARFHFELPGSTHGFRAASASGGPLSCKVYDSEERSASGKRALKIVSPELPMEGVKLFHKTYYASNDFSDSRYDPAFSPIVYPGQRLSCHVCCDTGVTRGLRASLFVLDGNAGRMIEGGAADVGEGFAQLTFDIPAMEGARIDEVGVLFRPSVPAAGVNPLCAWMDDFDISGAPDYTIDFAREHMDVWNGVHKELSQFTYLKGIWFLEDGAMNGSCSDFGEAYTGDVAFRDYCFTATVEPLLGDWHGINLRVQGAVRSYAVALCAGGKLRLMKNENGYKTLCEADFPWSCGGRYRLTCEAVGGELTIKANGMLMMRYTDVDGPYLNGAVGASIRHGSRCHYRDFAVKGL